MVKVNTLCSALVVFFWCGITLAAIIPHREARGLRRATALSTKLDVQPFSVAIKPRDPSPRTKGLAVRSQNISAYMLGDAPDPTNHAHQLGFIAQHGDDGSTTYFMPPPSSNPLGPVLASHSPDLSWKVGPKGMNFTTPGTVISGRIYIVDGYLNFYSSNDGKIIHPDPHNTGDVASQERWGFIEFSHVKDSDGDNEDMTVNLSFVDWVSLPLGMSVTFEEGGNQKTMAVPGLKPDSLVNICKSLSALDSFWPKLCIRRSNNAPLRALSPEKYISLHPDDHDALSYYEPYINEIWEKYKNADLKINTQVDGPSSNKKVDDGQIVTCRVGQSDNVLHCDNDAGDFSRPVSRDIYGCNSGPFSNPTDAAAESWSRGRVRPRLCAAFVRSTLHLDAVQPSRNISSDKYYQEHITNHYARLVHENLIDGMGYAFSYDDVNPGSSENSAGLVSTSRPLQLKISINT
ncbi:hypothetical protein EV127DRAFT_468680 [Xylaria flabelliformis]|nr:hypothetical protein EV127DRAFT_468680 [Xylaria flabelliformis]